MKRRLLIALVAALVPGAANAQDAPRAYDVCSVKPSLEGRQSSFRRDPGGGFASVSIPAVSLVMSAFGVQPFQVFGLPAWATSDGYDVECKDSDPAKSPNARFGLGIQALLADRFHLQYHRESRRLPVATLRVGKSGLKATPAKEGPGGFTYGPTRIHAESATMAELARFVSSLTREKVVDKTGLTGRYAIDLTWTLEESRLPDVPFMANVLSDRLGLTIARSVESTEVIIVDHLEKPAANLRANRGRESG